MQKLFGNLTSDQADLCMLILSASAIACVPVRSETGWEIWVEAALLTDALDKMAKYFRENPDPPPPVPLPPPARYKTLSGLWVALMLAVIYGAAAYHHTADTLALTFGAAAGRIMDGELYRTVTALMLHASIAHLLGNMAGIALFGSAVAWEVRPGVGWLLILLTGILGNLANAALQPPDHLSIGASTAIFGAIGLLSAFQFWNKYRQPGQRLKAWLPLAGGLALLGFLGTAGVHTDIMAHLFGLIAGCLLGTGYSLFIRRPLPDRHQIIAGWLTVGILLAAWFRM